MAKTYGCIEYKDNAALSRIEKKAGTTLDHNAVWEEAYNKASAHGVDIAEVRINGLNYIEVYNIDMDTYRDDSVYGETDERIQNELLRIGKQDLNDYIPKILRTIYQQGASFNDIAEVSSRLRRLANAMEEVMDNWNDYDSEPSIPLDYKNHWELMLLLDTSTEPLELKWLQPLLKKTCDSPKIERNSRLAYEVQGKDHAHRVSLYFAEEAISRDIEHKILDKRVGLDILRYLLVRHQPQFALSEEELRK